MISVDGLEKRFTVKGKPDVVAVAGVHFTAQDGKVCGLLGPNGAGKTTTLRMLSTLIAPSAGTATIDGFEIQKNADAVKQRVGLLTDARGLYTRLSARENIRYYGQLRGLGGTALEARIEELADLMDLRSLLDRRTDGFSQGERMKVAIARALVHAPRNVILDEPSNGLDIKTTRNLRELIRSLRDAGCCVVLSSHIMQEVLALCDDIVIIAHGRVAAQGAPASLLEQSGQATLEEAFLKLAGQSIEAMT